MSKIIKARFIVNDNRKSIPKREENAKSESFNQETADALYLETKAMLEELVGQAQKKADEIILKAREEAQAEVEHSRQESTRIKDAAYKEGYDQGYQTGLAEASNSLQNLYGDVVSLISSLQKEKEEFLRKQEVEMIELVVALAEKLIGTVFETRPEVISHVVKNTLEHVKDAQRVTVRVNPIHIPYLSGSEEITKDTTIEKLNITEDPTIKPGDCQVVTENGFLDSILEEQLVGIRQALLEVVDHA